MHQPGCAGEIFTVLPTVRYQPLEGLAFMRSINVSLTTLGASLAERLLYIVIESRAFSSESSCHLQMYGGFF
jgi:hypothetical protein